MVCVRVCVYILQHKKKKSRKDRNITGLQEPIMYAVSLSALPFLNAECNMATSPKRLLSLSSTCFQA